MCVKTDIALDYLNRARMNRDSDADDGYDSHSGVRRVSPCVTHSMRIFHHFLLSGMHEIWPQAGVIPCELGIG